MAKSWAKPGALLLGGLDGTIIGGKRLGMPTDIDVSLVRSIANDSDAWLGFSIDFPFGLDIEDQGFGMVHRTDMALGEHGIAKPTTTLRIVVRFPRDNAAYFVTAIPTDQRDKLQSKKDLSLLEVFLKDEPNANVAVHGFRMPLSRPGHPSEGWLNRDEPIADGRTMLDIFQQREFKLLVAAPDKILTNLFSDDALPPPFSYPYGQDHSWNPVRYRDIFAKAKGHQFSPAWTYDNDNAHLTVLTQSQAQDVIWVDDAAIEIRETKFPAYFVATETGNTARYFVIIPLTVEFQLRHESAWRRLTNVESFKLNLHESVDDEEPLEWDANIIQYPGGIDALNAHPVDSNDLVLLVRRALRVEKGCGPNFEVITFSDRPAANAALKQGTHR